MSARCLGVVARTAEFPFLAVESALRLLHPPHHRTTPPHHTTTAAAAAAAAPPPQQPHSVTAAFELYGSFVLV